MPYLDPAMLPGDAGLHTVGTWISAPGKVYGPYTWSVHQLVWVIDGSATIRSADEVLEVSPNSVFHTPSGLEHVITWDPRRSTRIGYVEFTPSGAAEFPRLRSLTADDVVITLLNHIVWLATERPSGWTISAQQAFDYALHAYRTGHSMSRIGLDGVYSELVARATSTVQRHWRGGRMLRITLGELASELGVSKRHLSRAFTEEFGAGPITTFRTLRILEAAHLLTDTTLPIREIATLGGFANEFHFSRAFKETTGFPPALYRSQAPKITRIPPQVARFHQFQAAHFHPRPGIRSGMLVDPTPPDARSFNS